MNCEYCSISAAEMPVKFSHLGKYLCQSCHPFWPGDRNSSNMNLHDKVRLGAQKTTLGHIKEIKDRVISRDDGKTVIHASTGRPVRYYK